MSFASTRWSAIPSSSFRRKSDRILIPILGFVFAIVAWAHPLAKSSGRGGGAHEKLDRAIAVSLGADPHVEHVRVIVRTRADARSRVRDALAGHGDRIIGDHPTISAFSAVVHRQDLPSLVADEDVEGVSLDAVVTAHETSAPAKKSTLVATELPGGAPAGGSVHVAVIDSGLEPTPDLDNNRIIGFYDFTRGGAGGAAFDDYGHGTHVAGLIAGNGASSGGYYRGMAPAAKILALKVLDRNGGGYTSAVIEAIDFILKNQKTFAIDVINLSLGHPIFESAATDPLVLEVEKATQAGITVVVSAGNFGLNPTTGLPGYAGITSPGNSPSALTVGCLETQDTVGRGDDSVCPYSSRGPTWYDGFAKPDLVAAGHELVSIAALHSTLYRDYPDLQVVAKPGDVARYFRLSGTSMATAVASGAIAVLLDGSAGNRKDFSPNLVKALLEWTAIPVPGFDALTQGSGSLNVRGALALARKANPSVAIGSPWPTAKVRPSTMIGGVAWPWAQTMTWGNAAATGSLLEFNQLAWSRDVVWGDGVKWSGTVVWGNDVVWADTTTWIETVVWGNSLVSMSKQGGSTVVWGNARTTPTVVWGNLVEP